MQIFVDCMNWQALCRLAGCEVRAELSTSCKVSGIYLLHELQVSVLQAATRILSVHFWNSSTKVKLPVYSVSFLFEASFGKLCHLLRMLPLPIVGFVSYAGVGKLKASGVQKFLQTCYLFLSFVFFSSQGPPAQRFLLHK